MGGEMCKGMGFPAEPLLPQNCVVLPLEVHFKFPSAMSANISLLHSWCADG